MFRSEYADGPLLDQPIHDAVLGAAAPLDAELAQACARRLGLSTVRQAYGMTELSPGKHVVQLAEEHPSPGPSVRGGPMPGTVGKLLPNTEMRIVALDASGRDLGTGEEGEIWVRGPQVMKGYQVAPADPEAVLLAHEDIADAAVIGVRDDNGDEVPKAYVVRRQGAALTADDVPAHVAGRVAPYKKVRRVEFVAAVPRAASGKTLRRELRDRERTGKRPGDRSITA